MFGGAFSDEEIAVVTGGPEVGQAFADLAFDHLIFTGATGIARHVMKAAADNLVPLTLELGGKSPVILGRSADLATAAGADHERQDPQRRPDLPGARLRAGAEGQARRASSARRAARCDRMFPTIKDNPDYTAIIAQRHYDRIMGYIDDARAKGARVVEHQARRTRTSPSRSTARSRRP